MKAFLIIGMTLGAAAFGTGAAAWHEHQEPKRKGWMSINGTEASVARMKKETEDEYQDAYAKWKTKHDQLMIGFPAAIGLALAGAALFGGCLWVFVSDQAKAAAEAFANSFNNQQGTKNG